MKRHVFTWASIGFLVACGWVAYTFVTPADLLGASLRNPLVKAALFISCPISMAGRYFALAFWWIPPANAATYAIVALMLRAIAGGKARGAGRLA